MKARLCAVVLIGALTWVPLSGFPPKAMGTEPTCTTCTTGCDEYGWQFCHVAYCCDTLPCAEGEATVIPCKDYSAYP